AWPPPERRRRQAATGRRRVSASAQLPGIGRRILPDADDPAAVHSKEPGEPPEHPLQVGPQERNDFELRTVIKAENRLLIHLSPVEGDDSGKARLRRVPVEP